MDQSFDKLKSFLDEYIDSRNPEGKVLVFPARCGIGKSRYIRYKISEFIRTGKGAIIITDSINRLREYLCYSSSSNEYADASFLKANERHIAFFTEDTIADEIKTQKRKPILMMTTQRYFNLSHDEIIRYTQYAKGKRTKIIFDERPLLIEHPRLDIKTINDIDDAIHLNIDDNTKFEEKAWIVQQWDAFRRKMIDVMASYEQRNTSGQLEVWHYEEGASLTEDDERFLHFINSHRNELNKHDNSIYKNVYALKHLIDNGGTFVSQKIRGGAEYKKYFLVTLDNSSKVLDLNADVYVLDATSDIDPIYRQWFIQEIDCSRFNVPLKNMSINLVNIPTSYNQIGKSAHGRDAILSCIKNYINTEPQKVEAIFTYSKIENDFDTFDNVGHFGNLKGSNEYRDAHAIAQVGLNRYPDNIYRQIAYTTYLSENYYRGKSVTRVIGSNFSKTVDQIMNYSLLTDLEQNLFRSAIRNVDFEESVTYTVFLNTSYYADLVKLIRKRYEQLGAKVTEVPTPKEYEIQKAQNRNTSTKTNVQTFLSWYSRQQNGRCFRRADILKECDLTIEAFKNLKKSKVIKQIFNESKTDINGAYIIRK